MKKTTVVMLILCAVFATIYGADQAPSQTTTQLSTMGWWDCCLQIDESDLLARKEMDIDVSNLTKNSASWAELILNDDFIPGIEKQMIPVQGNKAEPDRFVYRRAHGEILSEVVIGRYSITITVVLQNKKHLNSRSEVIDLYNTWIPIVFKQKLASSNDIEVLESSDCPEFWFAGPVLTDSEKGTRRMPYTWQESIRCAIARDGTCLSFSVQKLPQEASSPPASTKFDFHTGWFKETIEKK